MEIAVKGVIVLAWFAGIAAMGIGGIAFVWTGDALFAKVATTGAGATILSTLLAGPIDAAFK